MDSTDSKSAEVPSSTPAQGLFLPQEAPHWQALYLEHCALHLAEETVATYRKKLAKFLSWWTTHHPEQAFSKKLGLQYATWLEATRVPVRSQGLSLSAVRTWGRFLVGQGRLTHNPWLHIQGPGKITTLATNFLSYSQIRALLKTFDRAKLSEHRDYVIVYLMLKSALRETELSRATVGQLGPFGQDSGMITVRSKGKKHRQEEPVLLVAKAWQAVQAYLAHRSRRRPLQTDAPLFTSMIDEEERPMSPHDMRRRIKRAYARAGIPTQYYSALSLRHTAAMQALLKKAPLPSVKTLMRHEDLATTKHFVDHLDRLRQSGANFLDHY